MIKDIGITLEHFAGFMQYHTDCFDAFYDNKDYQKLEEFVILCDYINYFREHLRDPRSVKIIEEYVIEIKNFAYTFNDYCDQYGYSDDSYSMIEDYTDRVLSL